MCGIIGYAGSSDAIRRLLDGLASLEYRGYDSVGISVFQNGQIVTIKSRGRLSNIEPRVRELRYAAHCGIGHTRWATHGEPSDINAHPHGTARVSLVHNGIIENYLSLKKELEGRGYRFETETDTEIATKLLDDCYQATGDPVAAIDAMRKQLRGSYAFAMVFCDHPGAVYAIRKDSPLLVAPSDCGFFVASDIPAVLKYTNQFFPLDEGEIAILHADGMRILAPDGTEITKPLETAKWDITAAEKGGFAHFMLKEIHEEPTALRQTIRPRMESGLPSLGLDGLSDQKLRALRKIHIVGCGTAMHAGLVGKSILESLVRIPVEVSISSEFRYNDPLLSPEDLVVVISQSGETADTIAALRMSIARGVFVLGIVNVAGSSIAREASAVFQTWAGPEISVASTKAYVVQLAALYLLAFRMAYARGTASEDQVRKMADELTQDIPDKLQSVIDRGEEIAKLAQKYSAAENIFFIGRGLDCALSHEGSLKLKEISYIHSESYAAGELKHGTISLITEGMPVVAIATRDAVYDKMAGNIKEVKARGARVILLHREGARDVEELSDDSIALPETSEWFTPFTAVAALQLLAYHIAALRGCDVDRPRNLAKSVTVE